MPLPINIHELLRGKSVEWERLEFKEGEEAVVNAVYHRGYDVREPVEIRIMHDELVVLSYPGPFRAPGETSDRQGHASTLPESAHRRVPEGAGVHRRPFHRDSQDH